MLAFDTCHWRFVRRRYFPLKSAISILAVTIALCGRATAKGAETVPGPVAQLAAAIDEHIEAAWRIEGITPAPRADDAEFFRRIYLDLLGRIPSVGEVRSFLADTDPLKRRRIVDRILESPAYFTHATVQWRNRLIPPVNADFQTRFQLPRFDAWLRERLVLRTANDQLVKELLALPVKANAPASAADLFYRARDAAPENLAAAASRVFLGVRLECAQCHDHPFSHWKRDEFWSLAAFFAGARGDRFGPLFEDTAARTIAIPDAGRSVEARFLDGQRPEWSDKSQPQQVLATWITARENPYFARAAVNRVWADLMGRGIVDPPDDFDAANLPSHPELLDKLANEFAAHGYDVNFLIRAITASRVYQLTSAQTDSRQSDPRWFARHAVRRLTADQLFDSLLQAAGQDEEGSFRERELRVDSPRLGLRELFDQQGESTAGSQATILQALAMMNGELVDSATSGNRCATLTAVTETPFFTDAERIETLFLATLSRFPRAPEVQRLIAHVESSTNRDRSDSDARSAAFADVFWALLNSSEFAVNH
jgi:hypothetical protein